MRVGLLGRGEPGKENIRPLNDAKAIESGANFIGETFLLYVLPPPKKKINKKINQQMFLKVINIQVLLPVDCY